MARKHKGRGEESNAAAAVEELLETVRRRRTPQDRPADSLYVRFDVRSVDVEPAKRTLGSRVGIRLRSNGIFYQGDLLVQARVLHPEGERLTLSGFMNIVR